eukprot:2862311-Amphidinium_carterae.8
MENGFGGSILQVDTEPAILAFAQAAAKELTIPWRTSAPYEHQSQGAIGRFHKTLFAQVRAIRFDLGLIATIVANRTMYRRSCYLNSAFMLHN